MTGIVVIPARMGSTRYPGKPLVELAGKPMIQWVFEAAIRASVGEVLIATPDAEIAAVAKAFGAKAVMTRADHPSGTDRIAEVAATVAADYYVNVQGDEPMVDPADIRALSEAMRSGEADMASLYVPCPAEDYANPSVVKVVTDLAGNALYFSRSPIPFHRADQQPLKRHLGLYAYSRSLLLRYPSLPQSPLEITESLEQLRMLENGFKIAMREGRGSGISVDTPDQAIEADRLLRLAANPS